MKDKLVRKEFLIPFILVTSLFALWGFANDITNPMVSAFKKVLDLEWFEAGLVQFAFYGGYFTMAIPAAIFIKRFSYKAGILMGLGLYATGAFLFLPAAKLEMFGFFLVAYYIMTFGLAFLETTSNPYILSMGSEETATRRLVLAQTFNPLGSLSGMLVARWFILDMLKSDDVGYSELSDSAKAVIRTSDLTVIRNPYVFLGIVVAAVFFIILAAKLPKNKDNDHSVHFTVTIKKLLKLPRYYEGVIAQFFYVGVQIMCWTWIFQYAENIGVNNSTTVYFNMIAMILIFFGRFTSTFVLKYISAGKLLMMLAIGGGVFTLGTIFIQGMIGLYSLVLISLCMSLMFPTIYGIALRGLGDDAKFGSAGLIMAILGGAVLTPLQGKIIDIGGDGFADVRILGVPEVNFSFILPFICFVVIAIYGYRSFKIHLKDAA